MWRTPTSMREKKTGLLWRKRSHAIASTGSSGTGPAILRCTSLSNISTTASRVRIFTRLRLGVPLSLWYCITTAGTNSKKSTSVWARSEITARTEYIFSLTGGSSSGLMRTTRK